MTKRVKEHIVSHCDSFAIKCIPQEVLNEIKGQLFTHNIFRIQSNDSVMCRFHCIAFKEYMLAGKTLSGYKNLFLLN